MKYLLPLILLVTAGCQPGTGNVGSGPRPTLSPDVKKFVEEYMAIPSVNKSLAISADGRAAGAGHCAQGGRYGAAVSAIEEKCNSTDPMALAACQSRSTGSACYIYAWGNEIVWGGRGQPVQSPSPTAPSPPPATPSANNAAKQSPGAQTRRFVAIWEGVSGPISGELTVLESQSVGQLKLTTSNNLSCAGVASFTTSGGEWAVRCSDGESLSGNFRALGPSQGAVGEGKDSRGRKVSFALSAL
jgi:hypothetical protein